MGENDEKPKSLSKPPLRDLGYLCSGVIGLWILITFLAHRVFPDWATSGQVGDTFGAANALFSGLAFAGVLYALNLQRQDLYDQRSEMIESRRISDEQLQEMRATRELQGQPLALPKLKTLSIERPRLFYSPPERKHSAQSRYFVDVGLENPTQYAALNVNSTCLLELVNEMTSMDSVDQFIAIVPPGHESSDADASFMFVGDETGSLFDSIRQNDPRKVPMLHIVVVFRSSTGAYFRLAQGFNVYASAEYSNTLSIWHAGIAGFKARYKREMAQLIELKEKQNEDRWDVLFESLKSKFESDMGETERLAMMLAPKPKAFDLKKISKEEYDRMISGASYPQIINAMYDCPSELDSR